MIHSKRAGCSDRLKRKVEPTMYAQIIDLFQNGHPQQVIGFVMFCMLCLAAVVCLAIGGFQHAYNGNGRAHRRAMRRRLRRATRR